MPYAELDAVQALNAARRITATSVPNATQAAGFLVHTAAELDSIVARLGYSTPVSTTATSAFALLSYYTALGGHCLVEESAPTSKMADKAREMWEAAKKALADGEIELPGASTGTESRPRGNDVGPSYFPASTVW